MSFPLQIYLVSFLAAFGAAFLSMPFWKRGCLKWNLVDDPGPRKIHSQPVPLAGGLSVLTGLVVPLLAAPVALSLWWVDSETAEKLSYGLSRRSGELVVLGLGALGMLGLGLWDDRYELSPSRKFAGQVLIALLVASTGIRVTLFVPNPLFSYAATVLWILTVTNAFNFVDNMNGLAAGLAGVGGLVLAGLAARHGQYLVAALGCLTAGALAGFLPYNFPRGTAFLGDSGSHLAGYLMAILSILPDFHTSSDPRPWAVLSPLLVLAVPLADLMWVVIWRWRTGRPFYLGDTNHLSHQLLRRGLSPAGAVMLLWCAAAALGCLAFALP